MDPEVVKEFLLGDYCLHGGTGWWKYEFCYGNTLGYLDRLQKTLKSGTTEVGEGSIHGLGPGFPVS